MKKLYNQFNRLGLNDDTEPMHVSELEKERIKRKVLKQHKKRLPRLVSVAVITLASILILSVTVSITNPTLAANLPIIGNIFNLFQDNEKEFIFDNYDSYVTKVDMTQESNGVRVTITDAVYDQENITLAYTIESVRDLGFEPSIWGETNMKIHVEDGDYYLNYHGITGANQLIEKVGKNKYAGVYMIYLKDAQYPESILFTWNMNTIGSTDRENPRFSSIEGNWDFELNLNAIDNNSQEFDNLVVTDNGLEVRLKEITETPISTSFYFTERVMAEARDEDRPITIDYEIVDNLGNEYNVIGNGSGGNNLYVRASRSITTKINEKATSLTITPIIRIYKLGEPVGTVRQGELIEGPLKIKPIVVPLNKNN